MEDEKSAARLRPVVEGLFNGTGRLTTLLAGRRRGDGRLIFPLPASTPGDTYDLVELGRNGTLWSWTIQRFAPKSPYDGPVGADFRPYAVGYIELPGELIVESRLVNVRFDELHVGLPMRTTTEIYRTAADGTEVITYAFEPGGAS